jgi:beta-N-acetylhexosaminidase
MQHKYTISENAHAVLLPAFARLKLSSAVTRFLSNGGCSMLLGESRNEYVARTMNVQRQQQESAETFLDVITAAKNLAGDLIVAVDQEIAGIQRLHKLVAPFPSSKKFINEPISSFEVVCADIALQAKQLGINCFLAPILDIVTGPNPWLQNRTWSTNVDLITAYTSAFIRSVQGQGVIATAKHFPGFSRILLDPATHIDAEMITSADEVKANLRPFIEAIQNHVEMIMTGPAPVNAIDPIKPASLSFPVNDLLRNKLNFSGVILTDDLDSQATLCHRSLSDCAIEALIVGADLLLIADINNHIDLIVTSIQRAVQTNLLSEQRLRNAAQKVRDLALKYGH